MTRNGRATALIPGCRRKVSWRPDWLAGAGGFEPRHFGFGLSAKLGTKDFSRMTSETQRPSAFGRDRACKSHGHRPRQGAALFVGRAGEQHWVPAIRVFRARGLHAASGLIALRLRIIR